MKTYVLGLDYEDLDPSATLSNLQPGAVEVSDPCKASDQVAIAKKYMDDTVLEVNQSINAVNYMGRANFNVADNSCTSFWKDSGDVCPCSVAVDTLNAEIAAFNTDATIKTQTLENEIGDLLTQFIAKNDPKMV